MRDRRGLPDKKTGPVAAQQSSPSTEGGGGGEEETDVAGPSYSEEVPDRATRHTSSRRARTQHSTCSRRFHPSQCCWLLQGSFFDAQRR